MLYIFWFLHQTTTSFTPSMSCLRLYIFWFLHQTTTLYKYTISSKSCISFDSYIKPQLRYILQVRFYVVYLLIPTSNHNDLRSVTKSLQVVYLLIPTSNHNFVILLFFFCVLYIFWFLHQTTTYKPNKKPRKSCISFDSYIKPQLPLIFGTIHRVVYLLIPTSNHNRCCRSVNSDMLYIFWFLHQTTTCLWYSISSERCISFDSYIKPQLRFRFRFRFLCCISFDSYIKPQRYTRAHFHQGVVYLLIPTSNHNWQE